MKEAVSLNLSTLASRQESAQKIADKQVREFILKVIKAESAKSLMQIL